MKIMAWNMAHQTRERPIPPKFLEVIEVINPDVLSLNEYVHGESRQDLIIGLNRFGYSSIEVSDSIDGNNQVLIAAREAISIGGLAPPAMNDGVSESNWLHVKLLESEVEVVGIRTPSYQSSKEMHAYWGKLLEIVKSSHDRALIFIGDLNADPASKKSLGAKYLQSMHEAGWQLTNPRGEWSYHAGTRIDHAIVAESLPIQEAEYVTGIEGITLASADKESRISDHAALLIDIEIRLKGSR